MAAGHPTTSAHGENTNLSRVRGGLQSVKVGGGVPKQFPKK